MLAAAINPAFASVIVAEGFPYRSRFDAPVLRWILDPLGEAESTDELPLSSRVGVRIGPA